MKSNNNNNTFYFKFLILFISLICLINKVKTEDKCSFNLGTYTTFESFINCLNQIPFNTTVRDSTLQALKSAAELYTFLDISNQSPDENLPMQVDLIKELNKIWQRIYINDLQFQLELTTMYLKLNDAHSQYYTPNCYKNFLFQQPFAPISYIDSSRSYLQQLIFISNFFPTTIYNYYLKLGIDLNQYIGAQIISINNIAAVSYFEQYANTSVGKCKDAGTRFNSALTRVNPKPGANSASLGYWQQRTGLTVLPDTTSITYKLNFTNGTVTTVNFPWIVYPLKSYNNLNDIMNDYWDTSSLSNLFEKSNLQFKANRLDISAKNKQSATYEFNRDQYLRTLSNNPSIGYFEAINFNNLNNLNNHQNSKSIFNINENFNLKDNQYTFELLVSEDDLSFWQLNDNKTMVMYLDTFAPSKPAYYKVLTQGFEIAAQRGLNQLIIDLSNNGGGDICLGRSLIAFLQESLGVPNISNTNWGPEDIPMSTLSTQLVQNAAKYNVENTVWSPAFYDNEQGEHIANNDVSDFIPGVPHIRGGKLRNYSQFIHIDDCGDFGYKIEPAQKYTSNQIIIVTNGFCGSMCSYFANHIALYNPVKTVVLGGMLSRKQMQYTAFPGGQVMDDPYLYSSLLQLRMNISCCSPDPHNDIVPRLLLTTAAYRYTIREVYPPAAIQYISPPLEFAFQPADYHLYFSNFDEAVSPNYMWYKVLNLF
eukprot:TRINITY_DN163_c0_g2_i1.p1 TRINITY_DN163_c0_g2~~TRINITY_DN163_c0_g2_i1.p1  ORF type:complete len:706 (-),score=303.08 TRINITY_DN163_c0_g2_i1:139-2256(-)